MAKTHNYNVIGVMSGTSLDGIDLIYVEINSKNWTYSILNSATIPYPNNWQEMLMNAINLSEEKLIQLDNEYTTLLSQTITNFIRENSLKQVDAVCSHGHTVKHRPELGVTLQIGNQEKLADDLGIKVICDFRVDDVKLGGQGAPLVPVGDHLFFNNYDYCLNLGGFANVSYENKEGNRIAFDICPVNIVLNYYCSKIGLQYDDQGILASNGIVNEELLNQLNKLKYYSLEPPKSLGLEWVKEFILPKIEEFNLPVESVLRTFVEHIATQISLQLKTNEKVLITGGGAYNKFLISRLQFHSKAEIVIPSKELIEYKEALIFGLLGVLKLENKPNCLSSVTGAKYDHSSGKIFLP